MADQKQFGLDDIRRLVLSRPSEGVIASLFIVYAQQQKAMDSTQRAEFQKTATRCADLIKLAIDAAEKKAEELDDYEHGVHMTSVAHQAIQLLQDNLSQTGRLIAPNQADLKRVEDYVKLSTEVARFEPGQLFGDRANTTRNLSSFYDGDPNTSNLFVSGPPKDRTTEFLLLDEVAKQSVQMHRASEVLFPAPVFPLSGSKLDVWNNKYKETLGNHPLAMKIAEEIEQAAEKAKSHDNQAFFCSMIEVLMKYEPTTERRPFWDMLTKEQQARHKVIPGMQWTGEKPPLKVAREEANKDQRRKKTNSGYATRRMNTAASSSSALGDSKDKPTSAVDVKSEPLSSVYTKPATELATVGGVDAKPFAALASKDPTSKAAFEQKAPAKDIREFFARTQPESMNEEKIPAMGLRQFARNNAGPQRPHQPSKREGADPKPHPTEKSAEISAVPRKPAQREIKDIALHLKFASPGKHASEMLYKVASMMLKDTRVENDRLQQAVNSTSQFIAICAVGKELKDRRPSKSEPNLATSQTLEPARVNGAAKLLGEISIQIKKNGFPELDISVPRSMHDRARLRTMIPWFTYSANKGLIENWWRKMAERKAQEVANFIHGMARQTADLFKVCNFITTEKLVEEKYVPLLVFIACLAGRSWTSNDAVKQAICNENTKVEVSGTVLARKKKIANLTKKVVVENRIMDSIVLHFCLNPSALAGIDASLLAFIQKHCIDPVLIRMTSAVFYQQGRRALQPQTVLEHQVFQYRQSLMIGMQMPADDLFQNEKTTGFATLCYLRRRELKSLIEDTEQQLIYSGMATARAYAFVESVGGHLQRAQLHDALRKLGFDAVAQSQLWSSSDEVSACIDDSVSKMDIHADSFLTQVEETLNAESPKRYVRIPRDVLRWFDKCGPTAPIILHASTLHNDFVKTFQVIMADCKLYQRQFFDIDSHDRVQTMEVALLRWCAHFMKHMVNNLTACFNPFKLEIDARVVKVNKLASTADVVACHDRLAEGYWIRCLERLDRIIQPSDDKKHATAVFNIRKAVMIACSAVNPFAKEEGKRSNDKQKLIAPVRDNQKDCADIFIKMMVYPLRGRFHKLISVNDS